MLHCAVLHGAALHAPGGSIRIRCGRKLCSACEGHIEALVAAAAGCDAEGQAGDAEMTLLVIISFAGACIYSGNADRVHACVRASERACVHAWACPRSRACVFACVRGRDHESELPVRLIQPSLVTTISSSRVTFTAASFRSTPRQCRHCSSFASTTGGSCCCRHHQIEVRLVEARLYPDIPVVLFANQLLLLRACATYSARRAALGFELEG